MLKYADQVQTGDRIQIPGFHAGPEGLLVEDVDLTPEAEGPGTRLTVWMPQPNARHMMEIVLNPEVEVTVIREATPVEAVEPEPWTEERIRTRISDLQALYPKADPARIEAEVRAAVARREAGQ